MTSKQDIEIIEQKPTEIATNQAQDFKSLIMQAVSDKSVDADKLHRVLDFSERIYKSEAEQAFHKAMIAMRDHLPEIVKNSDNAQTNSKYAKIEEIQKRCDPILKEHGFYYRFDEEYPDSEHITTICYLTHKDGHTISSRKKLSLDASGIKGTTNKTQVHAAASTGTYGQRLSLGMVLSLKFVGFDNDGNGEFIGPDLLKIIQDLIDETNSDTKAFCQIMKVSALTEIPQKDYAKALNKLHAKKRQLEAKNDKEAG